MEEQLYALILNTTTTMSTQLLPAKLAANLSKSSAKPRCFRHCRLMGYDVINVSFPTITDAFVRAAGAKPLGITIKIANSVLGMTAFHTTFVKRIQKLKYTAAQFHNCHVYAISGKGRNLQWREIASLNFMVILVFSPMEVHKLCNEWAWLWQERTDCSGGKLQISTRNRYNDTVANVNTNSNLSLWN